MEKDITFLGSSLSDIQAFPAPAKRQAGYELSRVQLGIDPTDWKPISTVGQGVREIRIREASGIYRVMYIVKIADHVHVLHAFVKKTQKTEKRDIDLARKRLQEITS